MSAIYTDIYIHIYTRRCIYTHIYICARPHAGAEGNAVPAHCPHGPAAPGHGAAHPQRAKQCALPALCALKVLCLRKTQS